MRRWRVGVAILACGLALAACGSEPPEVAVGAAAPAGEPLDLAEPQPYGLLAFNDWPKSCELLTDDDVRAVLPQTAKIERRSGNQTFDFGIEGALSGMADMTVIDATCIVNIWLPGRELEEELPSTDLTIQVQFAGTPDLARENYDKYIKRDEPCPAAMAEGLDDCTRDAITGYALLKRGVAISVDWAAWYPWVERFQGQGEGEQAAKEVWRERIVPEFLRSIASKLP